MNHRGGWALIKATWSSWMQHRGFFFVLAFGWMVPPLVALFVWSAAAADGAINGISQAEFSGYYLVLVLANQFTYAQANWTVGDVIREGSINHWLIRPLAPLYQVLSTEVAGKVVTLVFVIPISALLAFLLKPEIHTSPANVLTALLSLLLAWGLRFAWGFWLAVLAFWLTRADSFLALQDALVFVFSGMVAPVPLLLPALKTAATILPFRYMVGFPVEILIGALSPAEIALGLAIQCGWLALAVGLSLALWKQGIRRYSAVGG